MENGNMKERQDFDSRTEEKSVNKFVNFLTRRKLLAFLMFVIIGSIILALSLVFRGPNISKNQIIEDSTDLFRLPNDIIPLHYVLETQLYLVPGNFRFNGKVEVTIKCIDETDKITIHSSGLRIKKIAIRSINGNTRYKISDLIYMLHNELIIIKLLDKLKRGNDYKLSISYSRIMDNSGRGLFYSTYQDKQQVTHYVASTQFQPMFARKAFPCFDEPALKATFDIVVVRWKNMTSLSNMPKLKTESRGIQWEADIYKTSMKMSTELVAFVVGEYVGITRGRVTFWSPKDEIAHIRNALDLASRLLEFYEDLLHVTYEAPKLDLVTVTLRNVEAMENWGLITFSKSILYHGENFLTSTNARKSIVRVVAHEIAHQWFGNLVTPKWWSDIWLSEGISSYMEHIASATIFPEYSEISKTILRANTHVFNKDCLSKSSSTVWKNVTGKVSFIFDNTFDDVTYEKGAVITRMVHYILGDEKFWTLLSKYLKENSYGSVDENDFWRYMTESPGANMTKVMPSWTHLSGLPIVSVKRNYMKQTATFSQISCKNNKESTHESDLWHIPLSLSSSNKPDWNPPVTSWMNEKNVTMEMMPYQDEWILVNGQNFGNYIVNYDRRNWNLLAKQLKLNHEVFSAEQRYKILADANNLWALGNTELTIEILLDLSSYLHKERILPVFSTPTLNFIYKCLLEMEETSVNQQWKDFVVYIFGPIYNRMGWDSAYDREGQDIANLRQATLYWLCTLKYQPCVNDALRKFHEWNVKGAYRADLTSITLPQMLCTAAASEDSAISRYLYEFYLNEKSVVVLVSLGCSSDSFVIDAVLNIFLKMNDMNFMLLGKALARNEKHWIKLFSFIDENFQEISNKDKSFRRILRLLRIFNHNLSRLEKILKILRKNTPNVTGWKKTKLNDLIRDQEKLIPKLKSKKAIINRWLTRKAWLNQLDDVLYK